MQQNNNALGTEKIGKLVFRLAVPSVVAQLINLVYNMVDRIYIGHIAEVGRLALTGVGVCMPLMMILMAFSQLIGAGGAPLASIALGKQDTQKAERILGTCAVALTGMSVLLMAVVRPASESLLLLFGASSDTLPYALDYMNTYIWGTLFSTFSVGLNAFITAQGFTKVSMISVLVGAVCNIILDPIFIFALHMGVRGAALATVLSQGLSAIWVLAFLSGKRTKLRLRRTGLRIELRLLGSCLALGLSPFMMQLTECVLSICFNRSLLRYGGDIAVGAMTIFATVMQFAMLPLMGVAQGVQPITGYNYGAGNKSRVAEAFKLLLKISLSYSCALWLLILLFPQLFILPFTNDAALITYSSSMIRIYFAMIVVMGAQIACQNTFLALGNAKTSLFLALLRKVFLLIPLIYILPCFIPNQALAVFLAEPISDTIAVSTTLTLFWKHYRSELFGREANA